MKQKKAETKEGVNVVNRKETDETKKGINKMWYSDAPQYRTSRDQQISSVIGGFLLLPI